MPYVRWNDLSGASDLKSIAYLKEGQSGVYLAHLVEDLSIAAAIEPKVVRPNRDIVSQLVAQGEPFDVLAAAPEQIDALVTARQA